MPQWTGRVLSKVEIGEHLGQGGMADVYLGRHTMLNRPVAVKILHAHLTSDEGLRERFVAEAQSVAGLRHPHIVQVFDFDLVDGQPYIVMELLDGMSLAEYLEQGTNLPSREIVLKMITELGSALDYAHARGIVHRDIKPANVMLRTDGVPTDSSSELPSSAETILTDFGIARMTETSGQTVSGTIIGTPAYMSPEQVQGEVVDSRSDIYSLGVLLYELLSLRLPFAGESQASVMIKHITEPPPPLENVSPAVQMVLDKALAKGRDDRYQSAKELSDALEQAFAVQADPSGTILTSRPVAATEVTPPPTVPPLPEPATAGNKDRRMPALVLGAMIVAAVVVFLATRILGSSDDTADQPPTTITTATSTSAAPTTTSTPATTVPPAPITAPPIDPATPRGRVSFIDQTVVVEIFEIEAPPDGTEYHGWLIGVDNDPMHVGLLGLDAATLEFDTPSGDAALASFDAVAISAEEKGFSGNAPVGEVLFDARLSPDTLAAMDALYTFTRGRSPLFSDLLLEGAAAQAAVHDDHVTFALTAITENDLRLVKRHSEHIINVIVGEDNTNFADWDLNTLVENPGDGVGLAAYLSLFEAVARSVLNDTSVGVDERATAEAMMETATQLSLFANDNARLGMSLATADAVSSTVVELGASLDQQRIEAGVATLAADAAKITVSVGAPLLPVNR